MHKNPIQKAAVFLLLAAFLTAAVPARSLAPDHGLDIAGMDKSVAPGDDFFAYANGGWMKATEIPPDRAAFGNFDVIYEEVSKRTADLIAEAGKSAAGSQSRMVGDFYAAYLDEKAIETRGITPVKAELSSIAALKNTRDLSAFLGSQLRADVDPLNATDFYTDRLFGTWISVDFNNPTRNVPYLLQGGLGLPDRDNYLNTDDRSKELQAKYRDHIAAVLRLAGIAEAEAKADRIYGLEKMIAETHATRTESNDVYKANNPWNPGD